jgi:hypothetical protein
LKQGKLPSNAELRSTVIADNYNNSNKKDGKKIMSSDLYTDIDLFTVKVPVGCLSSSGQGLWEDDGTAVIVMSKHGSKRDFPFSPTWNISFIGSVAEFNNIFIDAEAYYFDDCLSQSTTILNGAAYRRYITNAFRNANPLSVRDMHARGYKAFGWPESCRALLASKDGSVEYRKDYGETDVTTPIKAERDLIDMVVESAIIKDSEPNNKNKVWAGRPNKITSL